MHRLICLLAIAFLFPKIAFADQRQGEIGLAEKVAGFIRELEAVPQTGIAVAIVKDDQVLLTKGFGLRDREARLPMDEHTLLQIASNTKAFTSLALAIAAEHGKVSWNSPVQSFLRNFEMSDARVTNKINLVDMLSHRSGLASNDFLTLFSGMNRDEIYSRLRFLPMNPGQNMGFREGFQYSNLMYTIAGRVLESRTGVPWDRFVWSHITQPLGMSETGFTLSYLLRQRNHSAAYANGNRLAFDDPASINSAGAIASNAVDMAKWLMFQIANGRNQKGLSLISERSLAYLRQPRVAVSDANGVKVSYGLGWFISQTPDAVQIWHGGNLAGFSSQIAFMPKERIGVAVLTNEQASDIPQRLANRILAVLRESTRGPFVLQRPFSPNRNDYQKRLFASYRAKGLRAGFARTRVNAVDLRGDYADAGYGNIRIVSQAGGGAVLLYGSQKWQIKPGSTEAGGLSLYVSYAGQVFELPLVIQTDASGIASIEIPFEPETPTVFISQRRQLNGTHRMR